jgi:hypothetical protein
MLKLLETRMELILIKLAGNDESNNQLLNFLDVIPLVTRCNRLDDRLGVFIILWIFSFLFLWNRESYWKWEGRLQDRHSIFNRSILTFLDSFEGFHTRMFPSQHLKCLPWQIPRRKLEIGAHGTWEDASYRDEATNCFLGDA